MEKYSFQEIDKRYNEAYELAFEWLKNHLLYMYNANKRKLETILNCMGTVAFYHKKNGEAMYEHEAKELIGYDKLMYFLSDMDWRFKLTGDPIKINENGITNDF